MKKQHVMAIHTNTGSTIVTPKGFALPNRCARLKRELKSNQGAALKSWGK